jgi:hypothetical protein
LRVHHRAGDLLPDAGVRTEINLVVGADGVTVTTPIQRTVIRTGLA